MISTQIIKIDPLKPDKDKILHAAQVLKDGGLVIFPTETVYGIGANMLREDTIKRLYEIKQRPKNKPFSIHINSRDKVEEFAFDIPAIAYRLMDEFWPGPLTLIFKSKSKDKVGLRYPANEIALKIISNANVPVVAPSANLSGETPAIDFEDAIRDFNGLVELAIDAGKTRFARESTIVDVSSLPVQIIREGVINKEDIQKILRKKNILFVCTGNSCRSVMAKFLLEKKLKSLGRDDVEVVSGGIMFFQGQGATQEVIQILAQEGIDVSSHIAQKISVEMIKQADLILVMEKLHEEEINRLVPQAKTKVYLLKEFAKLSSGDINIYDPIGRPMEAYRETFAIIKEAIEEIAKII